MHEAAKYPRGRDLSLEFGVIANRGKEFRWSLAIENRGMVPLPAGGWAIYFNFARDFAAGQKTCGLALERQNGDLVRLAPAPAFPGLRAGARLLLEFTAGEWAIARTDAPEGFFAVYGEGSRGAWAEPIPAPSLLPFIQPAQRNRSPEDEVPEATPGWRYERNRALAVLPEEALIPVTPTPLKFQRKPKPFTISGRCTIGHEPALAGEAAHLQAALARLVSIPVEAVPGAGAVTLRLAAKAPGYRLAVEPDGIVIEGGDAEAVFHGIQSLLQLLPIAAWAAPSPRLEVPGCAVADAPRFTYRGLHLDVARNFSDVETVKRILDLMALYKLNALHFHLTDDEGWRIEIAALPELTQIGGRRGFSGDSDDRLPPSFGSGPEAGTQPGSGYYSRSQFVEILRYAASRHIEVIPEIDLPGHGRAAIQAMRVRAQRLAAAGKTVEADSHLLHDPDDRSAYSSVQGWHDNVVCIARESCFTFVETVTGELAQLYREAGLVLRHLHIGGDEVPAGAWTDSPICAETIRAEKLDGIPGLLARFKRRLIEIGDRHGIGLGSWEELTLGRDRQPDPSLAGGKLTAYVWNNVAGHQEDLAYRLANAGFPTILCSVTNLYLDFACEKDPEEPGYYWGGFLDIERVYQFCPLDMVALPASDAMGVAADPATLSRQQALTEAGKSRILGIQGQLWGENVRNGGRAEYMLMPRLIAVAERAWAADPGWAAIADPAARAARIAEDWNAFANRLGRRELPRLDHFAGGIAYRVPVPGALVHSGRLDANLELPGFTLHYTLDGSTPGLASPVFERPIAVSPGADIRVAAVTATGRIGRAASLAG